MFWLIVSNPIFLFLLGVGFFCWYMGMLKRIHPVAKPFGPLSIMYLDYQGRLTKL